MTKKGSSSERQPHDQSRTSRLINGLNEARHVQRPRPKSPVAHPGSAAEAPRAPRPTSPPSLGGWLCEVLLAQPSWPTYCWPSSDLCLYKPEIRCQPQLNEQEDSDQFHFLLNFRFQPAFKVDIHAGSTITARIKTTDAPTSTTSLKTLTATASPTPLAITALPAH